MTLVSMKRKVLVLMMLLALACASRTPQVKQRGMNYACAFDRTRDVRYGSPASAESLRELQKLGVNWIAITPFGFHRGTPEIHFGGERVWETDDSLVAATKQAHDLGMRVMMKPHLWSRGGDEVMQSWSDEQWRTFFATYEPFIVHYATIARDSGADALSVGNELKHSTRFEAEWRRIIARVRSIYRGPITYGANFDEVFDIRFWDAVDWIGVSGYFPLVDAPAPDRAALVRAWQPLVARLGELSKKEQRPIVFTEIGYRSCDSAAWRQWEIPRHAQLNLDAQRDALAAFFEAVWPQPWLAGAYVWKWESYPNHSGPKNDDYFIEHKPAADVVREHFTR